MKKLLFIFLLSAPVYLYGQDIDSLRNAIRKLQIQDNYIKLNLEKSHDQFQKGTLFQIVGVGVGALGYALHKGQPESINGQMIIGLGAASIVTGFVYQIDSHRFIGLAGRRR